MDYSPGQPLTEEQRQQLSAVLEQEQPADFGFEARYTWTLPLLAEWIQHEFGQTISVRGISVMLKRMNLSFTKATYTYAKANEKVQAYFRKHTFGLSASWGTTSTEESKKFLILTILMICPRRTFSSPLWIYIYRSPKRIGA